MPQDENTEKLDLANPPFKTLFLSVLGNDGKLPYQAKLAIFIGAILCLGYAHAYVMNVSHILTQNIRGLFISPPLVIILAIAIVHVLHQIDPTLAQLNEVFLRSESDFKSFKEFVGDWRKPETSSFYYLSIVVFATTSFFLAMCAFFPVTYEIVPPDAVVAHLVKNGKVSLFTYVYYLSYSILWGTFLAIGLNRLSYSVRIIRDYGKRFIASDKIDLIHAITQEGLTSLADFAINIDIIVAIGTMWAASLLFEKILRQEPFYFHTVYLVGCILVFIIFSVFPLWQLHKEIVTAKRRIVKSLDKKIHQAGGQLDQGINGISLFHDLIIIRSKVDKMNTWGTNIGISIKMLILFLVPITLGALLEIVFEHFLSSL